MADKEILDQQLFDRIAGSYAKKDLLPSCVIARRHQLLKAVEPILSASGSLGCVVDIGCGIGAPAKYLRGQYRSYIGIDQSQELISAGQSFLQDIQEARLIQGNVKAAGPVNWADTILARGELHHMTQVGQAIRMPDSNSHDILRFGPAN